MREMFTSYLGKLVENTKDLLAHPSAEQATQDKETAASSLQGKLATPQEKRERPTLPALEKSKKRRIPFVALALVLVFTSLCVIAIVGGPMTLMASANSSSVTLHHSTFLPLDGTPAEGPGATPPSQYQPDPLDFSFVPPCTDHYTSYGTYDSSTSAPNPDGTVCWDNNDFQWGNGDLSCIVNPKYPKGILAPSTTPVPTATPTTTFQFSWAGHNQNTCMDNHTCYSNNASQQDETDNTIHDEVLGDDITCWNNACYASGGATTPPTSIPINDKCGTGKPYDKFACAPYSQATVSALDPQVFGTDPLATGMAAEFVNPTAYNPLGFAEFPDAHFGMPTGNANGQTIDASGDMPSCTSSGYWSCPNDDRINLVQNEGTNLIVDVFNGGEISSDTYNYDGQSIPYSDSMPLGYTVACNKISSGWAFPCSDTNASSGQPFINYNSGQSLDGGQVNAAFIKSDWLSGNADPTLDNTTIISGAMTQGAPGHLEYTYLNDTVKQPGIKILFPYSLALGFLLITPALILIGYQFLWASWTLGRANAMEAFGRMILSISAIATSYYVASMLIDLTNTFNTAVVNFHATLSYPTVSIGGQMSTFTLAPQGENDPSSFRGIVVPISRWGCIANDFVSLLSSKFWTDAAQFIPFVGGAIKFAGNVANAVDFAKHAGEFIVLLLSINLCTQVFIRVVLLNYYVLTGPLAFGCWGLPGGVGQRVVSSWTKGFCSLLFAQTAQIFVLTTFPLILPDFPNLPLDRFGFLSMVFEVLPRVLILAVTIKVPNVMGTGATKAVAQAGTVVAGAVAAAGGAAMNVV